MFIVQRYQDILLVNLASAISHYTGSGRHREHLDRKSREKLEQISRETAKG